MQREKRWAAHAFIDELLTAAREGRAYDWDNARVRMGHYLRLEIGMTKANGPGRPPTNVIDPPGTVRP